MKLSVGWVVLLLGVSFIALYGAFVAVGFPWPPLVILVVFVAFCIRSIWQGGKGA